MKKIERQIRNHEFEIRLDPDTDTDTAAGQRCNDPVYIVDGVIVHPGDFETVVALLSAEAPK